MYKEDLALNNLQWLIKPNQTHNLRVQKNIDSNFSEIQFAHKMQPMNNSQINISRCLFLHFNSN